MNYIIRIFNKINQWCIEIKQTFYGGANEIGRNKILIEYNRTRVFLDFGISYRRANEFFEVDDSQRPSRISVKKGKRAIYLYQDKNRCQICQKTVNPERLTLKFRNPYQNDRYDWKNVLSVCEECKDKEIVNSFEKKEDAGNISFSTITDLLQLGV